ncbi:hypothetical protein BC629DRAFT_129786 [Irpex lacteus]|nr:hypothetical protein BC629DRAFT_129786 [Irpex lacteus]
MGNQLTILSTHKENVSCQPMNRWEDPWDARSEWSSGATDGSEESLDLFDDLRIRPDETANKQSPGAHIPPELFDNVLFYVNVHRALQARDGGLSRGSGRPSSYDALTDLKRCSLVCRFWANRCRQYMFAGRTLEIYRSEDAEIFRRYAIGGCAALIPVHQLIGEIQVYLRYDGLINSFLHLLYLSVIRQKLRLLSIHGPIPTGFHPAKLDTPHWGSPPSVVLPRSFLRNQIRVSHIHLPSISHVSKYLRHLICAADIILHLVTWDGEMPISLPGASNAVYRRRKPLSMKISASHCTDNINLALTAAMINPGCPLHRLSDQDRVWITTFLRLSWTSKRVPRVHIAFDVLEQEATIEMYYPGSFGLILNDAPATDTNRPATHLRVVGIHAYINISVLPIQFDTLFDRIRTRPTISTAVILFESLYCMKTVIQRYPDLFRPDAEYVRLVLAYADWEQYRAVGIDLTTMKPNGVRWTDLPCDDWRSDACDTGHIWSTRILQQQMRK